MAVLRQSITIGSIGTDLVAAFNSNAIKSNLRIYNVEDYGAVHDGATDDTSAIQSAITAVDTAGGGIIYFPNGVYVLNGALVGSSGGTTYNSQLTIPYLANSAASVNKKTFYFLGESVPNMNYGNGWNAGWVHKPPTTGVIWKSTLAGTAPLQSVICAGNYNGSGTQWSINNSNQIVLENIQIQPIVDGSNRVTLSGINFIGAITVQLKNICVSPWDIDVRLTGIPQNNCIGISMPSVNCGVHNSVEYSLVAGFETGFLTGDHTVLRDTATMCCLNGYSVGINYQAILGERIGSYWCKNNIKVLGEAYFKINQLQVEWADTGSMWFDTDYTLLDASSYGHGELCYNITAQGVGFDNTKFSKSGGTKVQCIPFGFAAASSFTVTGARNTPEAALKNLITALAAKGIIIDSTTET